MLTANSVEEEGEYLKTLSPRNDILSLSTEVMKRSCSSKPKDALFPWYVVVTSTNPFIWVLWAKARLVAMQKNTSQIK